MQTTQILLIFSVTTLTVVLAVIGIYVALILKEVRENLKKFNPILDNLITEQNYVNDILSNAKIVTERAVQVTNYVQENVVEPIGGIVSLISTLKNFMPKKKTVKRGEE